MRGAMHSSARSHRIGLIDQDAVLERRWQLEVVHTTAAHSEDGDVIGLPRRGEEIAGDGRGHEVAVPFDQRGKKAADGNKKPTAKDSTKKELDSVSRNLGF